MDDWMPWKITRNFVRAFFPTLALAICWDLWRNLHYSMAAKQLAVMVDVTALAIILVVRLSPPWASARNQLHYIFNRSWTSWMVLGLVMLAFLFPGHASPDGLVWVLGYAFYADLSRVCRTDVEDAMRTIKWIYGIIAGVASQAVFYLEQMREGAFPWRDAVFVSVFLLVLAAIGTFKWWGRKPSLGRTFSNWGWTDRMKTASGPCVIEIKTLH
jgi:hypothetical protein